MVNILSVIKEKFISFIINISTSGRYNTEFGISDYLMRYVIMNFIIIFGGITLVLFTFENWYYGRPFTAAVCAAVAMICPIAFVIARISTKQVVPSLILSISYLILCILVTYFGEADGANFIFIYIYPPITVMTLGLQRGIIYSLFLIVVVSLEMFVSELSMYAYPFEVSIRMLVVYLLVFAIIITMQIARNAKSRLINIQRRQLLDMATTDFLTRLNNRRAFMEYLEIIWRQSHRLKLPLTVMIIDVDYFKKYNDTMGHLEGDKALIAIAQCMKGQLKRETDYIARFGGEEFVCLIPYIESADENSFANKMVESVESMKMRHPKSECSEYLTISLGMASATPDDTNSYNELLSRADSALYKAKQLGRNRVEIAD